MTMVRRLRGVTGAADEAGGFFGTIPMFREFWAEDPSWTNPGNGNDLVTVRDNGTTGGDLSANTVGTGSVPTYVDSGAINSRPAFRFERADSANGGKLNTSTGDNGPSGGWTMVAVCQLDVSGTVHDANTTVSSYANRFSSDGSDWSLRNVSELQILNVGTYDTDPHIWVARFKAGDMELFQDGVSLGADTSGALYTSASGFRISGNYVDTGGLFDGDICYVAQYDGDLTAHADYDTYIAAIQAHYGLTPATPFLGAPFGWEHAYDAAGPEMAGTYSDGDPVTGAWLDEVQSFNSARAGGGTLTYQAAGLGGRPAIDFDGTGYFSSDLGVDLTQPVSVVTVMQADTTATGIWVDGRTSGKQHQQGIIASNNFRLYTGLSIYGTTAGDTASHVVVTVADGTSSLVRLDGVTETVGSGGTAPMRPLVIGATRSFSDKINGRVAAVGIYAGDITTEPGFADWETDILDHYGITAPTTGGFFGTIGMLREFWAEDPSWTSPGDGNDLTTWRDNGSLAGDLTVGTFGGGDEPIYVDTGGISSRPAIRFLGAGTSVGGYLGVDTGTPSGTVTVIVVGKHDVTGAARYMTDAGDFGGATELRLVIGELGGGTWRAYHSNTLLVDAGTADTDAHVFVARFGSNDAELIVDGTSVGTDVSGTYVAPTGFTVGSGKDRNGQSFDGDIAYAAVYDGDLTAHADYDTYISNIRTYYGI